MKRKETISPVERSDVQKLADYKEELERLEVWMNYWTVQDRNRVAWLEEQIKLLEKRGRDQMAGEQNKIESPEEDAGVRTRIGDLMKKIRG